jgi:flagellar hook assembly protein FlgD
VTTAPVGGRDRARHAVVATAMLALFVVALGVFLLPFAFPTPPPIVTRFQATVLFSPNFDGRRDSARINVRLHDPSRVTVEILKDGTPVVVLLDDIAKPKGFFSTKWDGTDAMGRRLADGTYAIKLRARSGDKRFNTTRNITIDTAAPRPATMTVTSATLAGAGPGECRLTFTARDPGSVVLEARRLDGNEPVRRLGARPVRPGQPVRWAWDGKDAKGRDAAPGTYLVSAALSDAARNRATRERTCWVGRIAGTPTIARPVPRDRVGVRLRTTAGIELAPSTPISLVLRRRTGTPGVTGGDPLGRQVGGGVRGRVGTLRITLPRGINPAALWLVASTLDGRSSALVELGGRP